MPDETKSDFVERKPSPLVCNPNGRKIVRYRVLESELSPEKHGNIIGDRFLFFTPIYEIFTNFSRHSTSL